MTKSKNLLRHIASIRLVEEFKSVRSRGHDIFVNLNKIVDKYLQNHTMIEPIFQDMVESECMEAVYAREMTQQEMKIILDKLGISTYAPA